MTGPKPTTVERIITAALALIGERGLGNVTMIDVALTAGIARQTVYNHFPDIDSIAAEAISRHNAESTRQLRAAVSVVDTPAAKMEQVVRHIAQISPHQGHNIDFDHSLAPQYRNLLDDYKRALDAIITTIITNGTGDESFRQDLDPTVDAVLVRHLLVGLSQLIAAKPNSAATTTSTATRTILAALTSQAADDDR